MRLYNKILYLISFVCLYQVKERCAVCLPFWWEDAWLLWDVAQWGDLDRMRGGVKGRVARPQQVLHNCDTDGHARECTWTMHTLFKYTCVSMHTYTIYWCMYAYLRAHTPFLQYTNFYIFATTHLQCSSNPRDSQEPLISISNVFVSILPAYISSVYYFRLIRKLCLACFGAYGNCMCCVSVSGAQNTKKKRKKAVHQTLYMHPSRMLSALFSFLWVFFFTLTVASLWKREWNEHPQQDLWELEKISTRTTDQTVAQLGWILFALYERSRCGRVTFLTRLAAPLLCLTICVAAQPNPIRFSSFSHSPFHALTFLSSY